MAVLTRANEFVRELGQGGRTRVIRGSARRMLETTMDGRILAALFFEPSTRTRLSFEAAAKRLGGSCVAASDAANISASKGEVLADTIRVVSSYADVVVLRHPYEGAARLASEFSSCHVINAGDGRHEHPTQTLCDLFTLWREVYQPAPDATPKEEDFAGKVIAVWGDLKNGRTVHSLILALMRLGASVATCPAEGYGLPESTKRRILLQYGAELQTPNPAEFDDLIFDALYVSSKAAGRPLEFEPAAEGGRRVKIHAMYVTRFQKERASGNAGYRSAIDENLLKNKQFKTSRIMHPLPRVTELPFELDKDDRAIYFQQAAYGVPVRMALLELLLTKLSPELDRADLSGLTDWLLVQDPGRLLACTNADCISVKEKSSVPAKFDLHFTTRDAGRERWLECHYCDHEAELPPDVRLRAREGSGHLLDLDAAVAEARGHATRSVEWELRSSRP